MVRQGSVVGDVEGDNEGDIVGDTDGDIDGVLVGDIVGEAVNEFTDTVIALSAYGAPLTVSTVLDGVSWTDIAFSSSADTPEPA